jgi:hypothetical protein
MNTIKQARIESQKIMQAAIDERVKQLKASGALDGILKDVSDFALDPYCKGSVRELDETGMLESVKELDISAIEEEESEVLNEILETLTADHVVYGTRRDGQTLMRVCLGFPIVLQSPESRHDYVVYSEEFKELNLTSREVKDTDHALMLIEKAMRKAKYFPKIVKIDRYGCVIKEISTGLGNLTDKELSDRLSDKEKENE